MGDTITVARGDSPWAIARRRLGDRAKAGAIERQVLAIWNANPRRIGTGDPNLIFAAQRLRIPRS